MFPRLLNIIIIMFCMTAYGSWPDRWNAPLSVRSTQIIFTNRALGGAVLTGDVNNARASDVLDALYERELLNTQLVTFATSDNCAFYRNYRDVLVYAKAAILSAVTYTNTHFLQRNWVDIDALNAYGHFAWQTDLYTTYQWTTNEVWADLGWPIYRPFQLPLITRDRLLEKLDLPREAISVTVTNIVPGWSIGVYDTQYVAVVSTTTSYINTWFDYTPYRDLNGSTDGLTNGFWLGAVAFTSVAPGYTSGDYGYRHVTNVINELIAYGVLFTQKVEKGKYFEGFGDFTGAVSFAKWDDGNGELLSCYESGGGDFCGDCIPAQPEESGPAIDWSMFHAWGYAYYGSEYWERVLEYGFDPYPPLEMQQVQYATTANDYDWGFYINYEYNNGRYTLASRYYPSNDICFRYEMVSHTDVDDWYVYPLADPAYDSNPDSTYLGTYVHEGLGVWHSPSIISHGELISGIRTNGYNCDTKTIGTVDCDVSLGYSCFSRGFAAYPIEYGYISMDVTNGFMYY